MQTGSALILICAASGAPPSNAILPLTVAVPVAGSNGVPPPAGAAGAAASSSFLPPHAAARARTRQAANTSLNVFTEILLGRKYLAIIRLLFRTEPALQVSEARRARHCWAVRVPP